MQIAGEPLEQRVELDRPAIELDRAEACCPGADLDLVDDVWIEPITEELDQADGVGLPPLVGVALPGTRIGLRGLLFAASGDEVAEPVAGDVSGWR